MSVAALAALAEDPIFGPAQYALPAASTESASVSCTSSCLSALTVRSGLEPVGAAYHALVFPESGDSVDLDAVEAAEAAAQEDYKIYRRVMRASLYDYYALLNLSEKNIEATEAEIRASYRKLSLLCHPDKATPEDREDAEARFKSMQKGFDVLTNESTRIDYDSTYKADDSIPGPKEGAGDVEKFLAVYGPVFARNARYSIVKPVPTLGDANTPYAEIDKFYNFWAGFKSWREFSRGDTERCGDSASRDERRRAAQKNKKNRELLKKEEIARVANLVRQAQAVDPRVVAYKANILNAKANEKQSAAAAKKAAEDAKKAAADAIKKAAEDAAAAAKKEADDARRKAADLSAKIKKFRAMFNRDPALAGVEGLVNTMLKIMDHPEAILIDKALRPAGIQVDANGFGDDVAGKLMAIDGIKALSERARATL